MADALVCLFVAQLLLLLVVFALTVLLRLALHATRVEVGVGVVRVVTAFEAMTADEGEEDPSTTY